MAEQIGFSKVTGTKALKSHARDGANLDIAQYFKTRFGKKYDIAIPDGRFGLIQEVLASEPENVRVIFLTSGEKGVHNHKEMVAYTGTYDENNKKFTVTQITPLQGEEKIPGKDKTIVKLQKPIELDLDAKAVVDDSGKTRTEYYLTKKSRDLLLKETRTITKKMIDDKDPKKIIPSKTPFVMNEQDIPTLDQAIAAAVEGIKGSIVSASDQAVSSGGILSTGKGRFA